MTELEQRVAAMQATMAELGKQMNEGMRRWREAHGILEWSDPGYLGNRCGWYPAKPKPRRRVRLDRRG